MVTSNEVGNNVLESTLQNLAAYSNQYQTHAKASLRLLDRRRRRAVAQQKIRRECPSIAQREVAAAAEGITASKVNTASAEVAVDDTSTEASLADLACEAESDVSSSQHLKGVKSCPAMTLQSRIADVDLIPTVSHMPSSSSLPLLDAGRLEEWPEEVQRCLDPFQSAFIRHVSDDASVDEGCTGNTEKPRPASEGLRLFAASFLIPHPEKAESGGEDSFFVSKDFTSVGVADGVGEWRKTFRLNPRAFADELMDGACAWIEGAQNDGQASAPNMAASALSEGFAVAKSIGSATALVTCLDATGSELGVANLGDSGLRQVRHQHSNGSDLGTRIVGRTREQQHAFNQPYQLARLPEEEDFPRLLAEGKGALVRAVRNTPKSRQDQASDAALSSFALQEGDLLLLGTDGVFDNLHDREICQLADCTVSPFEAGQMLDLRSGKLVDGGIGREATDPAKVAQAIAQAAHYRSRDECARTPFSLCAREAGYDYLGGKMDDITVVAAWVVKVTS